MSLMGIILWNDTPAPMSKKLKRLLERIPVTVQSWVGQSWVSLVSIKSHLMRSLAGLMSQSEVPNTWKPSSRVMGNSLLVTIKVGYAEQRSKYSPRCFASGLYLNGK